MLLPATIIKTLFQIYKEDVPLQYKKMTVVKNNKLLQLDTNLYHIIFYNIVSYFTVCI